MVELQSTLKQPESNNETRTVEMLNTNMNHYIKNKSLGLL